MSRWAQHFSALTEVTQHLPETQFLNHSVQNSERPTLEAELALGIETSFDQLTKGDNGWSYKGMPVMVFGVNVAEVDNIQQRENFYYKAHLDVCCEALKDNDRNVWVTSSSTILPNWNKQESFEVCHHCLNKNNYKGYSTLSVIQQRNVIQSFDFHDYIQWNVSNYFSEVEQGYWLSGEKVMRFSTGNNTEASLCIHCSWPLPAHSQYWVDNTSSMGIDGPSCICCLKHSPKILIVNNKLLLKAYAERYEQWQQAYIEEQGLGTIASQSIKFSWSQISHHFPEKWEPLITAFKQLEPADIYCHIGDGFALFAWAGLQRAVVAEQEDKLGFPDGWKVWTFDEVLENI